MLEVVSRSEPGQGRVYEDRVLVDEGRGLFAVADGVTQSSQGTGAAAADLAVRLLSENFESDLEKAMARVHEIAFARKKEDWSIGETTLTAMSVDEPRAEVCNIGNSPAILVQGADITNLYTNDTSLEGGLTQAVGLPQKINIHSTRFQLEGGNVVILASDGVEHALRPPLIYHFLMKVNAKEIADAIVEGAQTGGIRTDDDKTVIVLRSLKA